MKTKNLKWALYGVIAVFLVCLTAANNYEAKAEEPITVVLDGQTLEFDVQPTIIDGRTMVPMRVIFEALGATVEWNGETRTVTIVSPDKPVVTPRPSATPTPTATPNPASDAFLQTEFFEEISPTRAQSMFENNEKFVLIFYSKSDSSSIKYVPIVKQVAKNQKIKTYGVDVESSVYQSSSYALTFIWNYINRNSTTYPALLFVNGKTDVSVQPSPGDRKSVV